MTIKIAIVYYSTYGHVLTLAKAIKEGAESTGKAKVDILQVPETLPAEVLEKMGAPKKPDYPIATPDKITQYDALFFGYPTRFGNLPAQMTDFWGATGGLWASGALQGKPVGIFTSVSSPGGSQEATLRNFFSYMAHHGMVYIPLGYAPVFAELSNMDEVHAGTPYGASTFSGADGSRQPSALELKIATSQGESFTNSAYKLVSSSSSSSSGSKTAAGAAGAAGASKSPESSTTAAQSKTAATADNKTDAAAKKETGAQKNAETGAEKRASQTQPSQPEKDDSKCGVKCIIV